jgi:aspartyl protease family protein
VLDIDGVTRVLAVGATSPEGVKLLAADSREAVLEIDGETRRQSLGEHIRGGGYAPPARGASVTIAPDAAGMYQVPGSINGFQVTFIVDTGATLVSMNRRVAQRVGIDYRMDGTPSRSRTAAGVVPVWLVELDRVRVGDIEVRDVAASVHDADFPAEVLLGNSFLQRLRLERQGPLLTLTQP